jgi:hypothetical protein
METKYSKHRTDSEFISESRENIIEGARVFSEKASDLFNKFLVKLRDTAETAYDKGSEWVEGAGLTAQRYIERYRDRLEISELKKHRDEVATQLGNMCYLEFSGRYRFRMEFMKSEEFRTLLAQIRELDKQIIRIGERLEKE